MRTPKGGRWTARAGVMPMATNLQLRSTTHYGCQNPRRLSAKAMQAVALVGLRIAAEALPWQAELMLRVTA